MQVQFVPPQTRISSKLTKKGNTKKVAQCKRCKHATTESGTENHPLSLCRPSDLLLSRLKLGEPRSPLTFHCPAEPPSPSYWPHYHPVPVVFPSSVSHGSIKYASDESCSVWLFTERSVLVTGTLSVLCIVVLGIDIQITTRILRDLSVEAFNKSPVPSLLVFIFGAVCKQGL